MVYQNIGAVQNPNWRPSLFSSAPTTSKHRFSSKGRKAATVVAASLPFLLLLLDLWRVPIIILIATTGAQPACAVSIAAVSVSSNSSDTQQKAPSKLSFNLNEGRGDGSSVGLLSLSFGGLTLNNYQLQPKEPTDSPTPAKKAGIVKRGGGGGETRITSNQDVTTLALAVDNSSSVAIANINSSWNNVYVSIGTPTSGNFQYPPQQPSNK